MDAMTLLHIGAEQTVVTVGPEFDPAAGLVLAIGSQKTARDYFKQTPASPLEIENAIAAVEDEVTRAKALIPPNSGLFTADAGVRAIALHAGVTDTASMRLSVDAMERVFNRFASVSLGRPGAHEGLPEDAEFAATLLILREFMHHMQFPEITIVEQAPHGGG
jgi:exopolyphosphatase/pppGpp-phosphohydrolase